VGDYQSPLTLPMLIEQRQRDVIEHAEDPLRYRWISLAQIPEIFFFPPPPPPAWGSTFGFGRSAILSDEGFDWKEMDLRVEEAERKGKTGSGSFHDNETNAPGRYSYGRAGLDQKGLESYYTVWGNAVAEARSPGVVCKTLIEMGRGS